MTHKSLAQPVLLARLFAVQRMKSSPDISQGRITQTIAKRIVCYAKLRVLEVELRSAVLAPLITIRGDTRPLHVFPVDRKVTGPTAAHAA